MQKNYHKLHKAEIGKYHPIEETAEMVISKLIGPLLSRKTYGDAAERMLSEYNLDACKLLKEHLKNNYKILNNTKILVSLSVV